MEKISQKAAAKAAQVAEKRAVASAEKAAEKASAKAAAETAEKAAAKASEKAAETAAAKAAGKTAAKIGEGWLPRLAKMPFQILAENRQQINRAEHHNDAERVAGQPAFQADAAKPAKESASRLAKTPA